MLLRFLIKYSYTCYRGIFTYQKTAQKAISIIRGNSIPSPKLIFLLGNGEYMAMMREKLLEIKQSYKNLKLKPCF